MHSKDSRYQVFEKNGKKKAIHNFRTKKAALKKWSELKKAGTVSGEIWDTQDNALSRLLSFPS